jgi:CheY-like chemotaxis protein
MSRRVLVIDDEAGIRHVMRELVAEIGVEVDTVANGVEGLAQLTMHPYDVVISDYFMPGLAGMKLLGRIRETAPHVPVVLLTGSELIADSVPPDVVVLKKPIGVDQILECMGAWLERTAAPAA